MFSLGFNTVSKLAIVVVVVSLTGANALAAAEKDLDHAPTQEEIAAGRDLKLYDDGGTFSSKLSDHGAIPRIKELRDFLWSHWSQKKRRGYVRLETSDVDGDTTTISHIFVEPSNSGEWHVAVLQFFHWSGAGNVSRWSVSERPRVGSLAREKDMHTDVDVIVFLGTDGSEFWRL